MMPRRSPEVLPLVRELHQKAVPYKQISRELERRGFVNSRGEPYSRDSIKIIVREFRVDADWPLAPG